eukprot:1156061-Pelagomonas_calceolata.AAC.5
MNSRTYHKHEHLHHPKQLAHLPFTTTSLHPRNNLAYLDQIIFLLWRYAQKQMANRLQALQALVAQRRGVHCRPLLLSAEAAGPAGPCCSVQRYTLQTLAAQCRGIHCRPLLLSAEAHTAGPCCSVQRHTAA